MISRIRYFALLCFALAATSGLAQDVPQQIKDALKRADDAIAKIVAVPNDQRTFDNTVGAFDDLSCRLDDDTALFIFMENVSTDAKTRDEARAGDEAVSNWGVDVG